MKEFFKKIIFAYKYPKVMRGLLIAEAILLVSVVIYVLQHQ